MPKTVGIDLGTTNSVIAVIEAREPVVIPNSEGSRTTPSVVAFTKSGERLVGQLARRQAAVNPENTVYSIKRFMGRRFAEVESERKIVPFKVKPGKEDRVVVEVPAASKEFTPEEISAMILQKLKADAEAYLGEKVTDATSAAVSAVCEVEFACQPYSHHVLTHCTNRSPPEVSLTSTSRRPCSTWPLTAGNRTTRRHRRLSVGAEMLSRWS